VYVAESTSENNNNIVESFDIPFEQQVYAGIMPDLESFLSNDQTTDVGNEDQEEFKDDITSDILEQVLAVVETPIENTRNERNNNIDGETETVQVVGVIENPIENNIGFDTTENTESENILSNENTNKEIILVVGTNITENTYSENSDQNENEIIITNNDTTEIFEEILEQTSDTVELPIFVQNNTESILETISVDYGFDGNVSEEQFVQNTIEQSITVDQEITNTLNYVANQQDDEFEELNNILAMTQQKTFGDEENTDEMLTMTYVQPGLFNVTQSFNTDSNMADKEAAGVFGKVEDKSDAEKRAIEIIAANKEQQDNINNNYMDADQSGILGAMIVDTDVSAYRTSNIPDLSSWYKPEDIYKNVVYRDNVRGMYFLEKGSTDTYKQMVDEQYK
jgi:hypothetical protein